MRTNIVKQKTMETIFDVLCVGMYQIVHECARTLERCYNDVVIIETKVGQLQLTKKVCTKIVKFLNQCFAQHRYPKSVCTFGTVGFVNSRHFSDIEVVQNTDLRI